jgi:hypothetical protein
MSAISTGTSTGRISATGIEIGSNEGWCRRLSAGGIIFVIRRFGRSPFGPAQWIDLAVSTVAASEEAFDLAIEREAVLLEVHQMGGTADFDVPAPR